VGTSYYLCELLGFVLACYLLTPFAPLEVPFWPKQSIGKAITMRRISFLPGFSPVLLLLLLLSATSCKYYTRDIILKTNAEADKQFIAQTVKLAEANYRVAKNDHIEFSLFTNGGELLIDPNAELSRQLTKAGSSPGGGAGSSISSSRVKYLVSDQGDVLLPMVGKVMVEKLTMRQLDSALAEKYAAFYNNCFVQSKIESRRCFLFASGGGGGGGGGVQGGGGGAFNTPQLSGKVIKLEYEKMHLLEVLANAGSIGLYSKMNQIRIIRGDLKKPEVIVVDLSHIHTMARQDLTILPYDVIYIEPGRRPALDVVRDVSQIGSFFLGTLTLVYIVINEANRNR